MAKKTLTFEEKLERLEEIQNEIHSGGHPLKNTFKLFEEGLKLSKSLEKELDTFEKKIEILTSEDDED